MVKYIKCPAVTWLKYCRYGVKLYPINHHKMSSHSFCKENNGNDVASILPFFQYFLPIIFQYFPFPSSLVTSILHFTDRCGGCHPAADDGPW